MTPSLVLLIVFYVVLLTETLRELSAADTIGDAFN
jgi:hypothetical protein